MTKPEELKPLITKRCTGWSSMVEYRQANEAGFDLGLATAFKLIQFRNANAMDNVSLSTLLGMPADSLSSLLHGRRPITADEASYVEGVIENFTTPE